MFLGHVGVGLAASFRYQVRKSCTMLELALF